VELGREPYRARRGTEGRTLGRLSTASRRLDGRLMASINRSLKAGGSDGVQCRRALPAQRGRKGEGTDKRAPWYSERERGRESADRRALLRSERGKGEARGLSTRSGPRQWATCASRAGAGCWADNGPRPVVSAGCVGPGFGGWARFGAGDKDKRKTLLYFSEL